MGSHVLVVEGDSRVARSLSSRFHSIHLSRSGKELRDRVTKNPPEAVILDLEQSRLSEVQSLHREFPLLPIVCTHRIPDEELWVAALDAGASDVCSPDDVPSALTAVLQNLPPRAA